MAVEIEKNAAEKIEKTVVIENVILQFLKNEIKTILFCGYDKY